MAHMRWVMEVLGQGFALPLEELSIAQETTQLYSQWLFEPQLRPLAFRLAAGTADEQLLYQSMFHHYSLLFQVRSAQPPPSPGANHFTHHYHNRHPTTPTSSSFQQTPPPLQLPTAVLIQRHIELCKKVLTVLTMAGRQLGNTFSEETWEVLLKVILGVTDSLLREQPIKSSASMSEHSRMSDDLCEHLLRVLFELWLRSNIRQVKMWDILKLCFNGWTHRILVLHQWAASSLGLCQRVVRLLYGPGQGTDVVNLAVGGYNIGLDLQADFALYAWHRIIYLLKSPASLTPTNCLAAVNGIGRMVETFLNVGSSNGQSAIPGSPPMPSTPTDIFSSSSLSLSNHPLSPGVKGTFSIPNKPSSPDGNTIMHMFGAWLFEVSSLPIPESISAPYTSQWQTFSPYYPPDSYHEAQASAFGVLCRIFSKPQPPSRPFLRIYTERFYEALSIGLRSETSLPTILAHSAELFTSELEGVRMMVPDFVIGIRMAMSGQIRMATSFMSLEKQKQVLEDLHLAALRVAGCIMCLPNHFEKVELKEGWNLGLSKSANMALEGKSGREDQEILAQLIRVLYTADSPTDGSIPASKRFTSLKYYILEMLLNCLETETSAFNLRYLLHLIEVYVYEDVAFCPGLVGVVVKTIQEKCRWMSLYARLTYLLDVLDYTSMFGGTVSSISSGLHVVERVEELEASAAAPKPQQEKRRWGGGAAGNAMISVVGKPGSNSAAKLFQVNNKHPSPIKILNQESKKDKSNRKNRSANSSMSGHVRASRQELLLIQHAAEVAMTLFSNQLGNFPVWTDDIGPSRMSTMWDDIGLNRESLTNLKDRLGFEPLDHHHRQQQYHQAHFAQPTPELDMSGPVRYYLLDRRVILGCCETSNSAGDGKDSRKFIDERGPFAVITMRDSSGKNSWKMRMGHIESGSGNIKGSRSYDAQSTMHESEDVSDNTSLSSSKEERYATTYNNGPRVLVAEAADESSIGLKRYVRPVKSVADMECSESSPTDTQDETMLKTAFDEGEVDIEGPPQQIVKATGTDVFRILMAQTGYLSLENRSRIVPMHLSERLLAELQFLDDLRERDCIGVSVYFAQSGDVSYDELIHGAPGGLSKDFSRFLDCLGWPIQVESHSGFLGQLNKDICHTTPYFANRNTEVIFHVPYLMRPSNPDVPPMQDHRLVDQFRSISMHDQVAIVWVEDRERMVNLLPLIDQSSMVFILIHPLDGDSAGGLFWIRILIQGAHTTAGSVRLAANPLMIGPLADGMLVSRHSLGSLVRNTAISADKACRFMTDNYTEPCVVRARYIQEILQMHQPEEPESIAEFYRTMFTT
ncbi:hypothetical protein BGX20_010876 [Mortierella sp. AD010]|nr:hypothetical protein BGX20_010876 [Mortierella sp. AD010]